MSPSSRILFGTSIQFFKYGLKFLGSLLVLLYFSLIYDVNVPLDTDKKTFRLILIVKGDSCEVKEAARDFIMLEF